jgi:hypothetical protein
VAVGCGKGGESFQPFPGEWFGLPLCWEPGLIIDMMMVDEWAVGIVAVWDFEDSLSEEWIP